MKNNFNLANHAYIINSELHQGLDRGCIREDKDRTISKDDGIYLVTVRNLKNNEKILIYNYIYYDIHFATPLLYYFFGRNKINNLVTSEFGNYLVIIDNSIHEDLYEETSKLLINPKGATDISNKLSIFSVSNLLNYIYRVNYNCSNDHMSYIVDTCYKRNHVEFIRIILSSDIIFNKMEYHVSVNGYELSEEEKINHNSLHHCLFIVRDLNLFKNNIQKYGYNINEGPSSWRGQVSSMSSFINCVDLDFRRSLYNHNRYHSKNGLAHPLAKSKFSFKNIHMNMGNIRWISTYNKDRKIEEPILLTDKLIDKSNKSDKSDIFAQLAEFLSKLPINEDSQRIIENFLLEYSYISFRLNKNDNSPIDYDLISPNFSKLLLEHKEIINNYIDNISSREYNSIPKRGKRLQDYHVTNLLKNMDNSVVISILYGKLLLIISNYKKIDQSERDIYIDIGNEIVDLFYYNQYRIVKKNKSKNDKITYFLSDWKNENKEIVDVYDDKELRPSIGAILFRSLLENLDLAMTTWKQIGKTNREGVIIPTEKVISTLNETDKPLCLPKKLPMIVKPKNYSRIVENGITKEILGGYLLNNEKYVDNIIKPKWSIKEVSKIQDDNVIYSMVNNIASVGYKINRDVYNFIMDYGDEYNLIINDNYNHPLSNKKKLTQSEYIELESFLSQKILQKNIIGLSSAYYNIHEFFLPVRLDFRGRLNCISEYLNYQSNELAKSLLLFSKYEKLNKSDITSINYLKSYGANCYGNKLDKKSWVDRVNWVDNNVEDIINFRNGKLISTAENKLLFVAFCFEYNRWLDCLDNNLDYFETNLPIQLDATCNGYQHLAMLTLDYNLGEKLNLTKSSKNEPPKDFYNYIAIRLPSIFRSKLQSNNLNKDEIESYNRLSNLTILRSALKKAVMTNVYNVSPREMKNYIKEKFVVDDKIDDNNFLDTWYHFESDNNIKLKERDFNLIRSAIKDILNDDLFKFNKLIKYLESITKILTTIGLPITWGLPNGLKAIQSYRLGKEVTIKPFRYSKKSFTIKIRDTKTDKRKQRQALMPNLVHSLDACALSLLVDIYFKEKINYNFYSVHDCFAVTVNNVEFLMDSLKYVYTRLYSNDNYLKLFDENVRYTIRSNIKEQFDEDKLIVKFDKDLPDLKFPSIEGVLGKDPKAAEVLLNFKDSSYIVN